MNKYSLLLQTKAVVRIVQM